MNEHVKQLATKARLLTGWPTGEYDYQQFANLIIEECCQMMLTLEKYPANLTAREIKKHFGVGE
jgi:hypothetical protein